MKKGVERKRNMGIDKVNELINIDEKTLTTDLLRRSTFKYSIKHVCSYIFCCLAGRKTAVRENPKFTRHRLFEKGERKLEKELDVVTLIRSIRQLKLISRALLTNKQAVLLKF